MKGQRKTQQAMLLAVLTKWTGKMKCVPDQARTLSGTALGSVKYQGRLNVGKLGFISNSPCLKFFAAPATLQMHVASNWLHAVLHCGTAVCSGNPVGFKSALDQGKNTAEKLHDALGGQQAILWDTAATSSRPLGCGWKHAATGWAERNVLHAKLSSHPGCHAVTV